MARGDARRRGGGDRGLEYNESVLHACGGRPEVALEVLKYLDRALEEGAMNAAREHCEAFLGSLEYVDGERDGADRGVHRLLKAVSVILRLKGFNARETMMPIKEINLSGHPLLVFTTPSRAAGAPAGRAEPTVRALELAVHLARSSHHVKVIRLAGCQLGSEGGDKCMNEVVRLVRQVSLGPRARFLDEVDLQNNLMDAEAVRKIVEAAVKERCERLHACSGAPLWLDLSKNGVRNPESVFKNLQAWANWAHDRENALCLADQEGCTRQECAKKCMVHMPNFLDQGRPEQQLQLAKLDAGEAAARPRPLPTRVQVQPHRDVATREELTSAGRAAEEEARRLQRLQAEQRRREGPPRRSRGSARRRRREAHAGPYCDLRPPRRADRGRSRRRRRAGSARSRSRRSPSRLRRRRCRSTGQAAPSPPRASLPRASPSASATADDDSCAEESSPADEPSEGGGGESSEEDESCAAGSPASDPAASSGESPEEASVHFQPVDKGLSHPPLEQRVNRLFESLKRSGADGAYTSEHRRSRR